MYSYKYISVPCFSNPKGAFMVIIHELIHCNLLKKNRKVKDEEKFVHGIMNDKRLKNRFWPNVNTAFYKKI